MQTSVLTRTPRPLTLTQNEIGTLNQSITLYFKQGASDKVYHANLESKDDGYVVTFAYGRRGSTLTTGTKTPNPVDYEFARRVYEKLVKEKTAKGYTPGPDGIPYQHTAREDRSTGIVPQLLNAIEEDDLENFVADDRWWMQEKFDGRRVLIRKQAKLITGINRTGLVIDLPGPLVSAVRMLETENCLLDGEAVGDIYHAFDLLEEAALDLRAETYLERYAFLTELLETTDDSYHLRCAETAIGRNHKQSLLGRLRAQDKEGVVIKDRNAPYTPGRPSAGGPQLKLKFYATASCLVAGTNGTKRSVKLELIDGGKRVAVGNVTVPPNQKIPSRGEILEVRYLYAYPGGSLYQPTCLGMREDIDSAACTISQLKFKAVSENDGEEGES